MTKTTKLSFNINSYLLKEINQLMTKEQQTNLTQTLNSLITQGMNYETEMKNLKRREELILLKTLHIMRYLASTRSPEILDEIDERFQQDLPQMKAMILEEGINYDNV